MWRKIEHRQPRSPGKEQSIHLVKCFPEAVGLPAKRWEMRKDPGVDRTLPSARQC